MRFLSDQQQEDTAVTTAASIVGEEAYKNVEEKPMLSIYDTHSKSKKRIILFIISLLGFLSVFDELIYVPALPVMIKDFNTTETLGVLTIGVYLFGMSFSSPVWGVLSDYYGRKPITTCGLGILTLSSIGCYFSPNIYLFLVCRALQGCLVSVTVVVGQGTIADIYHPNDRGSAYGIFYALFSFSGFFAPVIGGQISQHYGWRSVFILVTIITFILLMSYVLIVPETQQYKTICTYQNEQKITLLESDQVSKPTLMNPCSSLLYLSDFTIIPYAFVLVCGFLAANCGSVLLSIDMAKPPYSYNESTVGLLFIPTTIAYLAGSITGGKLSDLVTVKSFQVSKILEGRMVPGILFSVLTIVGLTIYGWAVQYGTHITVPMLGQILLFFGQAATRPGILSYFTIKDQDHAASISAATNFLQTFLTSIVFTFTGRIVETIHDGPFFTILALCNLLTTIVTTVIIYRKFSLFKNSETKLLLQTK